MKRQFIYVIAGNGGQDAHDWARMLLHMMIRYADRNGAITHVSYMDRSEGLRIKTAMIEVVGEVSFAWEIGVHRLNRISPFDAESRRATSFAAVTTSESQELKWGTQIRSYVLNESGGFVTDHRTEKRTANIYQVLEGQLDAVGVA